MIVRLLVVAAAVLAPNCLEGAGNGVGLGGEEAGKAQIAEEVEKVFLLFAQGHR